MTVVPFFVPVVSADYSVLGGDFGLIGPGCTSLEDCPSWLDLEAGASSILGCCWAIYHRGTGFVHLVVHERSLLGSCLSPHRRAGSNTNRNETSRDVEASYFSIFDAFEGLGLSWGFASGAGAVIIAAIPPIVSQCGSSHSLSTVQSARKPSAQHYSFRVVPSNIQIRSTGEDPVRVQILGAVGKSWEIEWVGKASKEPNQFIVIPSTGVGNQNVYFSWNPEVTFRQSGIKSFTIRSNGVARRFNVSVIE